MDAWWQARQALRPQRETLKFVSRLLFPDNKDMQKIDVDASKMDDEWANRPDEVLEYCLRDAELPLDIMHKIQAFRRKEAVAAVAKVSLDTSANGTTSQLIDSLVIRLADRTSVGVPLTGSADRKEGQIEGGYVHDVQAGLHRWVAILDFKSMYPSIMIGKISVTLLESMTAALTSRLGARKFMRLQQAQNSEINLAEEGWFHFFLKI